MIPSSGQQSQHDVFVAWFATEIAAVAVAGIVRVESMDARILPSGGFTGARNTGPWSPRSIQQWRFTGSAPGVVSFNFQLSPLGKFPSSGLRMETRKLLLRWKGPSTVPAMSTV